MMSQYIVKRLLLMIPTLLGAALLIFLLMNIIPGDVALLIIGGDQGGDINPRELAKLRDQLGLNRPLYEQFFTWLWGVVRLDFGKSLWTGAPILEEIMIRLPLTLEVAIFATIVSTIIAIPLGTLAAIRQDSWVDYVVRIVWAKGLQERQVVVKHALKNALLPVITIIGTEIAFLIGGLVVTETVFTLNGLGRFMVDAIAHRDIPVVQTLVLFIAFAFVFVNLLVDLLYAWLDPRISYR